MDKWRSSWNLNVNEYLPTRFGNIRHIQKKKRERKRRSSCWWLCNNEKKVDNHLVLKGTELKGVEVSPSTLPNLSSLKITQTKTTMHITMNPLLMYLFHFNSIIVYTIPCTLKNKKKRNSTWTRKTQHISNTQGCFINHITKSKT